MPISKNGKPYYTQEQYEQARYETSALEYARSRGYPLQGRGNRFYMGEHDSMVFTGDGRWYWNSRGLSGGALEFCMYYEQMTLPEAVLTLTEGADFRQQAQQSRQISRSVPYPVQQPTPQQWPQTAAQYQPAPVQQTGFEPATQESLEAGVWRYLMDLEKYGKQYDAAESRGEQPPPELRFEDYIPQSYIPQGKAETSQRPQQAARPSPPVPPFGTMAQQPAQTPERPPFEMPIRAYNYKRLFAYLCKDRALAPAVVKEMVTQQTLYESVKYLNNGQQIHNACFVSYDPNGTPCGAFQRSLHDSGKPFKQDVAGSNKDYGWQLRGEPGCVAVFEASVDAASYASFCVQSGSPYPDLLALGGLNPTPLDNYLQAHPETEMVLLGLDMDEAGRAATARFLSMLKKKGVQTLDISGQTILHSKDWNGELQWYHRQNQPQQAQQPKQARPQRPQHPQQHRQLQAAQPAPSFQQPLPQQQPPAARAVPRQPQVTQPAASFQQPMPPQQPQPFPQQPAPAQSAPPAARQFPPLQPVRPVESLQSAQATPRQPPVPQQSPPSQPARPAQSYNKPQQQPLPQRPPAKPQRSWFPRRSAPQPQQPDSYSVCRLKDPRDIQQVCSTGKAKARQYRPIHSQTLRAGENINTVFQSLASGKPPESYSSLPLIHSDVIVMHQNGTTRAYLYTRQGLNEHPQLVKAGQQESAPQPAPQAADVGMEM